MFEETCDKCRESILYAGDKAYLKVHCCPQLNTDGGTVSRRVCLRHNRAVQDNYNCEDWMPKQNV